jgi:hypothetical protein
MNRSQPAGHAGPESSKAIYRVSLEVRVDNVADLYAAATTCLEAANMTAEEIEDVLRPDGEVHVANCLRMLLDPGLSPGGCSILDSSAEELWRERRTGEPTLDQMRMAFDAKRHEDDT